MWSASRCWRRPALACGGAIRDEAVEPRHPAHDRKRPTTSLTHSGLPAHAACITQVAPLASTMPEGRPVSRPPLTSCGMFARGAAAVRAGAVRASVVARCALACVVVAGRAGAVRAVACGAGVGTVRTLTGRALVVVAVVLVMHMAVVQVVHMVFVDDGLVAAVRCVGVVVPFCLAVCGDGHACILDNRRQDSQSSTRRMARSARSRPEIPRGPAADAIVPPSQGS